MKTKEFIERVKAYGYEAEERGEKIFVFACNGSTLLTVVKTKFLVIDTQWAGLQRLDVDEQEELFSIAVEYITTPVEEREDREYVLYCEPTDSYVQSVIADMDNPNGIVKITGVDMAATTFKNRDIAEKIAELANLCSRKPRFFEVVEVKDL